MDYPPAGFQDIFSEKIQLKYFIKVIHLAFVLSLGEK